VIEENRLHFLAVKDRHVPQASIFNQNSNTTSVVADHSVVNINNWNNNVVQTTEEKVRSPTKERQSYTHWLDRRKHSRRSLQVRYPLKLSEQEYS